MAGREQPAGTKARKKRGPGRPKKTPPPESSRRAPPQENPPQGHGEDSVASSLPARSVHSRSDTQGGTHQANAPPGFEHHTFNTQEQPYGMPQEGMYNQAPGAQAPPVITPEMMTALEQLLHLREALRNRGYGVPPPPPAQNANVPPPPPRQAPPMYAPQPRGPSTSRTPTFHGVTSQGGQFAYQEPRQEPVYSQTYYQEGQHHEGAWRQQSPWGQQSQTFQQYQGGYSQYNPTPAQFPQQGASKGQEPYFPTQGNPVTGLTEEMLEKMIEKKIRQRKLKGINTLIDTTSHPFTDELVYSRVPDVLYTMKPTKYRGKGDPIEHVQQHEAMLLGRTQNPHHIAMTFTQTLGGPASHWLFSLPKNSINSWQVLKEKFIQRYMGERSMVKGANALDDVKQEYNESLANYYVRFNQNISEIQTNISEIEIIHAFVRNLGRHGYDLGQKLSTSPVETMEELVARVKEYIDAEHYKMTARDKWGKPNNKKEDSKPVPQKQIHAPQQKQWNPPQKRTFNVEENKNSDVNTVDLVPLNAPLNVILKEMKEQNLWKEPNGFRIGVMGKDLDKWCESHEVNGHDTNNCRSLRFQINRIIQEGGFKHYVDHGGKVEKVKKRVYPGDKGKEKMTDNPPPRKRGTINVIHGGPAAGGYVSNSRDVYASQATTLPKYGKRRTPEEEDLVIGFSRRDMAHIVYPHDDALVITMEIDGFDVKRILVDGGSSSDLLHINVLEQLGRKREELRPGNFPLVSFAGAATYPLGVITLPTVIGTGWNAICVDVTFVVVENLGSYNGILGRTTINPYEMVPSTAHQKLKYRLRGRIGEVLGDQSTARKCYVNALRCKNRIDIAVIERGQSSRSQVEERFDNMMRTRESFPTLRPTVLPTIWDIKQGETEPIQSYFSRMAKTATESFAEKSAVINAFYLNMNPPTFLLFGRTDGWRATTSMSDLKDRIETAIEVATELGWSNPPVVQEGIRETTRTGQVLNNNPGYDHTPLNIEVEVLFRTVLKDVLPPPAENRIAFLGRNPEEWCHYHKRWGHSTNKCLSLLDKIEDLIGQGALRPYIACSMTALSNRR